MNWVQVLAPRGRATALDSGRMCHGVGAVPIVPNAQPMSHRSQIGLDAPRRLFGIPQASFHGALNAPENELGQSVGAHALFSQKGQKNAMRRNGISRMGFAGRFGCLKQMVSGKKRLWFHGAGLAMISLHHPCPKEGQAQPALMLTVQSRFGSVEAT
jgi:hypothetical protein